VTDLRTDHGLGPRAFGDSRNSFLWRLKTKNLWNCAEA